MRLGMLACAATLCLLLAACAQLRRPPGEPARSVAEELFDRGIAELGSNGETRYFETLSREHPASPWAARARAVLERLEGSAVGAEEELDRREQKIASAEAEVARLHAEEARLTAAVAGLQEEQDRSAAERRALFAELDRLRTDNARLLGDLEQLKNLAIEMELKR